MTRSLTAVQPRCSIARSLEVLGEKWTLLIVREAFWGYSKFGEFRERLGVAPDVLTDRLATLVEAGVLEKRSYRDEGARERTEYVLTAAGADLKYVMGALTAWGDEHRATGFGPSVVYVDRDSGDPVRLAYLDADDREVAAAQITTRPGPGAL